VPAPRAAAPFVIVFATFAIYLRIFADPHFYWDAQQYWDLGGSFGAPGHFSLLDFNSNVRGYSLPLLNRVLATIATHTGIGNVTVVLLFGSLEAALLGTVLIPRLVRALWPEALVTVPRVLVLNGIIFLFWRDHFGFPLSDFPAATLAVGALLAVTRRSSAGYAVAGLAIGLAWNIRPAYITTLVLLVGLVALRAGFRRAPLAAGRAVALVLAGVLVMSTPQILINNRQFKSWSPTIAAAQGLNMVQLTFGMNAQRNETYVGKHYPSSSVIYVDPSTRTILQHEHIAAISSYSQYGGLVLKYPTEMLGAWGRRFFNGLDVRYSTVYINDLGATWEWFSLVDYSLLFMAAARLLVPAFRRQLGTLRWPEALALCAAGLPAIPFAMEPRYFIPIQLVVYSLAVFSPGSRRAWAELGRSGQVELGVLYAAFVLVCITLSTSTMALIAIPT
jgi:hypothetical protein